MATFAHTKRNQHPENDHQLKKKIIGFFFVWQKGTSSRVVYPLTIHTKRNKYLSESWGAQYQTGIIRIKNYRQEHCQKKIKNF
jgi:hypothetical protein